MKVFQEFKKNFYKEGSRELHPGKIASSMIVLLTLIIFIIYRNKDLQNKERERSEHHRYTIGITGASQKNFRSSKPTIDFFYKILEINYKGLEHIDAEFKRTIVSNGGRYYVEFSSQNPRNSKLLLNNPVPDSILISPQNGWTYMPGYTKKRNN